MGAQAPGVAGMATHLSEEDQAHMLDLFKAFAVYDGQGMAKAILAFSGVQQECRWGSRLQASICSVMA